MIVSKLCFKKSCKCDSSDLVTFYNFLRTFTLVGKKENCLCFKTKLHPLFQQDGPIDGETVSHQDYAAAKGDRYPTRKPEDSDILRGDGSFVSETTLNADYTAKKGERSEVKKPKESEIWKVIIIMYHSKEVSQHSFIFREKERWQKIL